MGHPHTCSPVLSIVQSPYGKVCDGNVKEPEGKVKVWAILKSIFLWNVCQFGYICCPQTAGALALLPTHGRCNILAGSGAVCDLIPKVSRPPFILGPAGSCWLRLLWLCHAVQLAVPGGSDPGVFWSIPGLSFAQNFIDKIQARMSPIWKELWLQYHSIGVWMGCS